MSVSDDRVFIPKRALYGVLDRFFRGALSAPSKTRIEGVKWRGEGLFYTAFSFWAEEAGPLTGDYVIRVLNPFERDTDAVDRLARTSELLRLLDGAGGLSPRCLGYDVKGQYLDRPFSIESFVPGMVLGEAPKDPARWIPVAAREAVRLHALPIPEAARRLFPPAEDFPIEMLRRAEGEVNRLDRSPQALSAALDRARALLPAEADVVLLHGDAQLQNLVCRLTESSTMEFTWIDWEFARPGDRAYDLSIFTRGRIGELQGLQGGRQLYLDAYRRESGLPIPEDRVLYYEILLHVGMACADIARGMEGPIEQALHQVENLTRRRV